MRGMQPLVSVLICSYNAEKFIESTVKSVLNQTYRNIEVLILDNASTDRTVALVKQLTDTDKRVKLIISDKNYGAYPGLNHLLEQADGKFIAINDHDDIWHPLKLEKQITFLIKNIKYIGCGSSILNWYEAYDKYIFRSQPEDAKVAWHTSLVFRNNGYRYDTSVTVATDFYFIKNILCGNESIVYNFQEPLVLRRIFKGTGNLSGQWMKKVSLGDIFKLKIGILDKLALLNRSILPQELVEWVAVMAAGGNVPKKYETYAKTLSSMMSSRLP